MWVVSESNVLVIDLLNQKMYWLRFWAESVLLDTLVLRVGVITVGGGRYLRRPLQNLSLM